LRADRRIYAPPGLHWDGHWTLVLAPNGSIDHALRGALRKQFEWEGFAMLAPGLLGHPAADPEGVRDILQRTGAAQRVFVVRAAGLPDVAARALPELVDEGWDLTAVAHSYRAFIDQFAPLLALLRGAPAPSPDTAFTLRALLIHAYRRLQLHDPLLPLELLPAPWPGSDAYQLARAIYLLVYAPAEQHIDALLQREDAAAPPADAAFYQRFGGLRAGS
jgi:phenylacetic acid degradation operon negative regulatory protein